MLILGVDAAWSSANASGVALARVGQAEGSKPQLLAVGRSYREFLRLLDKKGGGRIFRHTPEAGSWPDFGRLLRRVEQIYGERVAVIALDLPLAPAFSGGHRSCERAIASRFGKYGIGTMPPPSGETFSQLVRHIFYSLVRQGYSWLHAGNTANRSALLNGFLETYPLPAILKLMKLSYRLPYKVSRRGANWPDDSTEERFRLAAGQLDLLRAAVLRQFEPMPASLSIPSAASLLDGPGAKGRKLKGLEDLLDAVVCAWVGCCHTRRETEPFGRDDGTIWVPK